jgi:hemolysin III
VARIKDPVSGWSHLVGAGLAVAGTVLLLRRADSVRAVVAFAVFGAAMLALYLASSLYHLLPGDGTLTRRLRIFDHLMIYVLIAGTYTPFCLLALRGAWGWSLLGSIWGLALAGMTAKVAWRAMPRVFSTVIYVLMGWLIVVAGAPLVKAVPPGGMGMLLVGGAFYTVGAVIYGRRRPDPWPGVFGFHDIWHLFVLAGTISHFWAIYRYLG